MSTEAALIRIERKVDALAKPKPFWVSAAVIITATGWDRNEMTRQRKANDKFWKVSDRGGYLYDINAIPEILLKKDQ